MARAKKTAQPPQQVAPTTQPESGYTQEAVELIELFHPEAIPLAEDYKTLIKLADRGGAVATTAQTKPDSINSPPSQALFIDAQGALSVPLAQDGGIRLENNPAGNLGTGWGLTINSAQIVGKGLVPQHAAQPRLDVALADPSYLKFASEENQSGLSVDIQELASAMAKALVPIGSIIAWSGNINEVPDGWQICDGTNGTPNLNGRMIAGAVDYTLLPSAVGDRWTEANRGQVNVPLSVGHTVSKVAAPIPSHTHALSQHTVLDYKGTSGGTHLGSEYDGGGGQHSVCHLQASHNVGIANTGATGEEAKHSHEVNHDTTSVMSTPIPIYEVIYIIRVE